MFDYSDVMTLVADPIGGTSQPSTRQSSTRQSSTRLQAALAELRAAIGGVSVALDFAVDPAELSAVVGDVVEIGNRFDALRAQYVSQVEVCGGPSSIGVRTVGQFVGAQTNADPRSVRPAGLRARWLRAFPMFEQAFRDGLVSAAHLDLLRRTIDGPRTHALLRDDQDFFIESARNCSFVDFRKVADYWLIAVDPDGDEPAEQRDRVGVSMRVGRGGRLFLRGELDAVSGQALRTAVASLAQKMRSQDEEAGTVRSENERQAAALVALVTRGSARVDGSHAVPLINIVMSQNVAEHLLAEMWEQTHARVPVAWNDIDGRCELIDGTPIHPYHARKLFGVATFRRHVMDAKGRLIDVAVNSRSFPQWMRNALHVQARGRCETPGCDAPHHWMQSDHVDPHSRGGKSQLSNGQNQCRADNQAKTNSTGHRPWRDQERPRRLLAGRPGDDDH